MMNVADYLLYWLNKNQRFEYIDYFRLKQAHDNVDEMLREAAVAAKRLQRVKMLGTGGKNL